jgi:hypothetical protein
MASLWPLTKILHNYLRYVDQNQFFRQIRNFIFDMIQMPPQTNDGAQPKVLTGIHWQAAQATSL